jgi:hypothetical protein
MDLYRLLLYSDDGRLIGASPVIHAANDVEAISLAEVMRGPFDAELLDVVALRIVKYLPNGGGSRSSSSGSSAILAVRHTQEKPRPGEPGLHFLKGAWRGG